MSMRFQAVDDRQNRIEKRRPFEVGGLARRLARRRVNSRTHHLDTLRQQVADRKKLELGERELVLEAAGLERRELDASRGRYAFRLSHGRQ